MYLIVFHFGLIKSYTAAIIFGRVLRDTSKIQKPCRLGPSFFFLPLQFECNLWLPCQRWVDNLAANSKEREGMSQIPFGSNSAVPATVASFFCIHSLLHLSIRMSGYVCTAGGSKVPNTILIELS